MKNRTFSSSHPSRPRRRRRGTTRLFVLGAAFMASTAAGKFASPAYAQTTLRDSRVVAARSLGANVGSSGEEGQATQTATFAIPAGTIGAVADQFRTLTAIRIVFANEAIRDLPSPGVSGSMTAEQALDRLLVGTGVGYVFTARDLVTMDIRTSEFVAVSGREAPTVASPKYTTPLRDVPQTIALIPRATIEEQGATTLSETLRNVPGITLQAGEGGGASNTAGDMFNMRGFNASNSLFVDGVRDDGLVSRDVFNLEQVEVFMGPTGSDVGRGTAAGYVNMTTKVPHLGTSNSAMVSYGNSNRARATADFNWSSPGDSDSWWGKAAFRLNALWQDGGVPGRNEVDQESRGVAPSVAFGLGTSTRLTASAQILRQDNLPDYGIPGAAWEEEPLAPATIQAPAPVDQSNYYGSSSAFDHDEASQDSYTLRVEHDLNRRFSARNQTRYNRADRDAIISAIQNPAAYNPATNQVTIARQGNIRENQIASNQTSMIGRFRTGALDHSSSFGLEFTHESQYAPALTGLGTRAPADIFNPNISDPVTGFAPVRSGAFTDGNTNTVSLYFFDTVELGDRWQLSGGARWERYDTDFLSQDATGAVTADLEANDSLVSGKLGLLYRLTPNANVYVAYGSSATPPGGANFALSAQPNNINNPNIEPQLSENFEVGTKWDFAGGRLSLNGAVFRTENQNVIFTVDATAVPPIFNQDDSQLVKGFTVGALGRITERWEIITNFGYLDSALNTQGDANNGNQLVLTPEFSGSIWSTYGWPSGVRLGGGLRQTSEVFINAANTIRSPGYTLVDALAEYEVNTHLTLRLNIYNLFDETYIRNVNNNGGRYNPGYPRSAMVTSQVRF
ncbi:MAG TPA: TonB-dependent siderophore receptor [Vicinamibacterales bacterium]|nr:TonB-dependent siderophore receptor [Vicinamibacterales bacterium]